MRNTDVKTERWKMRSKRIIEAIESIKFACLKEVRFHQINISTIVNLRIESQGRFYFSRGVVPHLPRTISE
jgi:hypothetical protein